MAGESERIGGIYFDLDANTAPVDDKFKKVDKDAKNLKSSVKNSLEGIQKNADKLKLGVTAAITAVIATIKLTISAMDSAGKAAQGLGLTTEEYTRLGHAAERSGLQVDQLSDALRQLTQRASEREEMSEGVRTFAALGISATTAGGQVKNTSVLIGEIAEKFSKMKDSAGKTQLAIKLFGDSGTRLIPMLNQGKEGLKAFADEADKLGITITDDTSKAAKEFNDTFTMTYNIVRGQVYSAIKEILPIFQQLADEMEASTRKAAESSEGFLTLNNTLKLLVSTGLVVKTMFNFVKSLLEATIGSLVNLVQGKFKDALKSLTTNVNAAFSSLVDGQKEVDKVWQNSANVWKGFAILPAEAAKNFQQKAAAPIIQSSEEIQKKLQEIQYANQRTFKELMESDTTSYEKKLKGIEAMATSGALRFGEFTDAVKKLKEEEGQRVLQEIMSTNTTPFADRIRELNELVETGKIKWGEYHSAVRQVTDQQKNAMYDLASETSNALTTIFKENKTAAIAAAIINTAVGATKALSEYPPPYSFAMAALQVAAGAAQIATIKSTSKSSSGGSAPSVAPTSRPAAAAPAPAQAQQGGVNQTMTIQGINVNQLYSGAQVKDLAKKLYDYQRDGGKVVFA